jgi:hypothetical protein
MAPLGNAAKSTRQQFGDSRRTIHSFSNRTNGSRQRTALSMIVW